MKERISRLRLSAFRGVPGELDIELPGGASLIVLGENGTGKSSIADAIEYHFSGTIRFLAREGRAQVNHQSRDADDVLLSLETTGSLGGRTTTREGNDIARSVARRETFLLNHVTLSNFMDMTKGEKWRQLFELIGLGPVDQLQLDLQQARNLTEKDRVDTSALLNTAARTLAARCDRVSEDGVLAALRSQCELVGVSTPTDLRSALEQDWATVLGQRQTKLQRATEIGGLADRISKPPNTPSASLIKAWNNATASVDGWTRTELSIFSSAQAHLQSHRHPATCPLCGNPIDINALERRIVAALTRWQESERRLTAAKRAISAVISALRAGISIREESRKSALALGFHLGPVSNCLASYEASLNSFTAVPIEQFKADVNALREWDKSALATIRAEIPPVTPQDAAVVDLILLVEQARHWVDGRDALMAAERVASVADQLHTAYLRRQNQFFSRVLTRISARVAQLFARLHPDEDLGEVNVDTWGDKGVELGLKFHGTHQRPPHAVLSESHLNSLGIALFLAMAEEFNERLGFIVLDDVVNSFDIAHRSRLAELLADEFEEEQLIVLTHDPLFFEKLRRLAPSWRTLEFTSWSYEEGPRLSGYNTSGLDKAQSAIKLGDRQSAATQARRALEELLQEACEALGAPMPFRRGRQNDRRDATEFLKGVRRSLKERKTRNLAVTELLNRIEIDLQTVMNVESHASPEWTAVDEVRAAVERVVRLNDHWTCSRCQSRAWSVDDRQFTSCRCGNTSLTGQRESDAKIRGRGPDEQAAQHAPDVST